MRTIFKLTLISTAAALSSGVASMAFADSKACEEINTFNKLPDLTITSTEFMAASEGVPAHCAVNGNIRGNVKFSLLLPEDWNQRFVMVGNGGKAGVIELKAAQQQMANGYASVSTNTGHDNTVPEQAGAKFGTDPEMKIDFGYRAVHETASASKILVEDYYSKAANHSYWVGCSTGGRQGLMEAQRYPDDFDGYVIGAPVYNYTAQQMSAPAYLRPLYSSDPYKDESVLPYSKLELLGKVVNEKCDAVDGLKDGLITNPRACDFSAQTDLPLCQANGGDDCFTEAEVTAIAAIYRGISNSDGSAVVHGVPVGSEAIAGGWGTWLIAPPDAKKPPFPSQHTVMFDAFNYLMFDKVDENYDYMTQFNFEADSPKLDGARAIFNATDPDLRDVAEKGAKIILYHGWGDTGANPRNTIDYYNAVRKFSEDQQGHPQIDSFMKLYMVPGLAHCRGGIGHDGVAWLSALRDWVEDGKAPDSLVGERQSDKSTRPQCPYPQQAVYNGQGDTDKAENFTCRIPG